MQLQWVGSCGRTASGADTSAGSDAERSIEAFETHARFGRAPDSLRHELFRGSGKFFVPFLGVRDNKS